MTKTLASFQGYLNSLIEYPISLTEDELYFLSDLLVPKTEIGHPIANSIYNKLQEEIDPYGER